MKRRWNANTWAFVILASILLIAAVDMGSRALMGPPAEADGTPRDTRTQATMLPAFKVGDTAPDFVLPDESGRKRALSEVLKRDTLLCFICGCNACRTMQTYLPRMLAKMKPPRPQVISVASFSPEAAAAYKRDVPLAQTLLFDPAPSPVMEQYKGHPCPRVYRVAADRKVSWIGSSPLPDYPMREFGYSLGTMLGLSQVDLMAITSANPFGDGPKTEPDAADAHAHKPGETHTGEH